MSLQPDDIIPLGLGNGCITLLVNDNGLNYLPLSASISTQKGGSGYYDVSVPTNTEADRVALRLLGVAAVDILKLRD